MGLSAADLRAVQEHFGFQRTEPISKDWQVIRAMQAVLSVDAAPFQLVFAGGTCLARAHKLIRRMSEDVDFKVVSLGDTALSANQRRKALGALRDRVTAALQAAGFPINAADPAFCRSRDANNDTVFQLTADVNSTTSPQLRPTVQIELSFAKLRQPTVQLPVASFVAEAFGRPAKECGRQKSNPAPRRVAVPG